MSHVHAIPEFTHWSTDFGFSGTGDNKHVCYFCRPHLYAPMPKGCTLCARCGVFIWAGEEDHLNEQMVVCEQCEQDLGVA